MNDLKPKRGDTVAMAAAKALVKKLLSGDRSAFSEFADRVEGKVGQKAVLRRRGPGTRATGRF